MSAGTHLQMVILQPIWMRLLVGSGSSEEHCPLLLDADAKGCVKGRCGERIHVYMASTLRAHCPHITWMLAMQDHLLPMHIIGVIIHGKPDKRYFFVAYPHLAGDSNLNLECIRLALRQHFGDAGLPPNLYVVVDNASDNKSRFVIGGLGWLVVHDYVNEVELTMLPVGHTHEDIDQVLGTPARKRPISITPCGLACTPHTCVYSMPARAQRACSLTHLCRHSVFFAGISCHWSGTVACRICRDDT